MHGNVLCNCDIAHHHNCAKLADGFSELSWDNVSCDHYVPVFQAVLSSHNVLQVAACDAWEGPCCVRVVSSCGVSVLAGIRWMRMKLSQLHFPFQCIVLCPQHSERCWTEKAASSPSARFLTFK